MDTYLENYREVDPKKGRLYQLIPVFIDFEMYMTKELRLGNMTLRQYLERSYITAFSMAVGESEPIVLENDGSEAYNEVLATLEQLASRPEVVIVAHNAPFDVRVMTKKLGFAQPANVWCTLEGAMGAWPDMHCGFSLGALTSTLPFKKPKLKLDLVKLGKYRAQAEKAHVPFMAIDDDFRDQLKAVYKSVSVPIPVRMTTEDFDLVLCWYNKRDVEALQELFYMEREMIAPAEQEIAMITQDMRKYHFMVNEERLQALITKLNQAAQKAGATARDILKQGASVFGQDKTPVIKAVLESATEDLTVLPDEEIARRHIFNEDEFTGEISSIRYARLKKIIHAKFAATDLETTSLKKLSPVKLAKYPSVHALLTSTTRAGKMAYHKRKARMFEGVSEVDVELGYARASTFRFSSPGAGGAKSLNLHNCISIRSLILTDSGWKPLLQLESSDKLWDGNEFVAFDRVTPEGRRSTIKVGAAELTPEQPVLVRGQKRDAGSLTLCQKVQCVAGGLCSSLQGLRALESESAAMDAAKRLSVWLTTSTRPLGVAVARIAGHQGSGSLDSLLKNLPFSGVDSTICATERTRSRTRSIRRSKGKTGSAPGCAESGWKTQSNTLPTWQSFLDGMIQLLSLIELTTTEDTNPATCVSLHRLLAHATNAVLAGPRQENPFEATATGSAFRTLQGSRFFEDEVFDIRGAGPRERFVCECLLTFNCPKHDKELAQPIRELYRVPDEYVLVRADFANVELRVEGILTDCKNIITMFDPEHGGDPLADPYVVGWRNMTRILIDKNTEKGKNMRQLSKAAHLALGFCQSAAGFTATALLKAIAMGDTSEEALAVLIQDLAWLPPRYGLEDIQEKTGCSRVVAMAAYHIHRLFNEAHPEFKRAAEWLLRCVQEVASCGGDADQAKRRLDIMYRSTSAMSRDMINMEIQVIKGSTKPNIQLTCGPWVPTMVWREPYVRPFGFAKGGGPLENALSILKSNGTKKKFTKQLAIENITQAAARNQLCWGILELKRRGFPDVFHVHDEIMVLVPKTRDAALAARDALVDVFGPKANGKPLKWATVVKPKEISITQSLWEDEKDLVAEYEDKNKVKHPGGNRWYRIEKNTPDCLDNLP